jgi:signal transduction histidine kinase
MSKSAVSTDKNPLVVRFHLVKFFSIGALIMFAVVAIALIYFENDQSSFFAGVQQQQNDNFQKVQKDFSELQESVARRDLLAIHESGNVNLTRLFANALWESDFAPFVAKASQLPIQPCRDIADIEVDGKKKASAEKKACYDNLGDQVMAIEGFPEINKRVFHSMDNSSVLKIKVFDTRGMTVYSSDHSQIGDDKVTNGGWQQALQGTPASALSHRGKFDAFEGTLSDRDVISSYLPVYQPGTNEIVGVFEVYSDVTKFLATINSTSEQIQTVAVKNQVQVEDVAISNQLKVVKSSTTTITIILALLALLFGGLFMIVRKADKILEEQASEKEHAQQQLAQAEKMASLGQMVAGVAHQLNTPIAFSYNNVSMVREGIDDFNMPLKLASQFATLVKDAKSDSVAVNISKSRSQIAKVVDVDTDTTILKEMLGDTLQGLDQMRELVENLRDFTRLDRAKLTQFDLNKSLKNVVYIAKTVINNEIELVEEFSELPEIVCNPSQLNQVFLNLVNNAAQSIDGAGTITVKSRVDGDMVRIEVTDTGTGIKDSDVDHIFENYYTTKSNSDGTGLGLPIARSIVEEYGGSIDFKTEVGIGSTFFVLLPQHMNANKAA